MLAQEKQVSAITYINSLMVIALNIVFLIFCISQASDGPQAGSLIQAAADQEQANLISQGGQGLQPVSESLLRARENRYSSPSELIKSGNKRNSMLQEHEQQQEFMFDKQQEGGPIGHRKSTLQSLRRPHIGISSRGSSMHKERAAIVPDSTTYDESSQNMVLSPHF